VVATEWRGMNTVNVATAWHRLAKLAKINRSFKNKTKMTHDPRVQILERLALQFVEDFDCMNLTNVVWSLAVLEHGFGGTGGSKFLNRALERIVEAAKVRIGPFTKSRRLFCRLSRVITHAHGPKD